MPNVTGIKASTPTRPAATGPSAMKNARFAGNAQLEKVAAGDLALTNGARGEAVSRVQRALLDMGYALRPYTSKISGKPVGGVDGQWGNQTTQALLNFQRHAVHSFPNVRPTGKLDAATLAALDALSPRMGGKAWQNDKLPQPFFQGQPVRVVVVKDEHRTYLFDKQGQIAGVFSNAVGAKGASTDTGLKKVTTRLGRADAEATGKRLWNSPKAFGDRILDLSWADGRRHGEELHGTYAYDQMGQDVSHGCVRHYNEDIVTLFDALAVGDKVAIVDSLDDERLRR